jgi:hypothetical protein
MSDGLTTREVEKPPLTWYDGAQDGIRTRDPHLGKVVVFVRFGLLDPLTCGSVHPVSSPSNQFAAVVERSTIQPQSGVEPRSGLSAEAMMLPLCEPSRQPSFLLTERSCRCGAQPTHHAVEMSRMKALNGKPGNSERGQRTRNCVFPLPEPYAIVIKAVLDAVLRQGLNEHVR